MSANVHGVVALGRCLGSCWRAWSPLPFRTLVTSERGDRKQRRSDASVEFVGAARAVVDCCCLAAAPAAILLTFAVAKALDQQPIVGPDPASWFRRVRLRVSYGVPLVVIALTFIGYAIRDRSPPFAFAAGLLFNVVATIVVLLRLARGSGALDAAAWIDVAQVNAIVAGVVALVWQAACWQQTLAASRRDATSSLGETQPREPLLLITQVALAAALCCTFLIPAVLNVAAKNATGRMGRSRGWRARLVAVAFAAAAASLGCTGRAR